MVSANLQEHYNSCCVYIILMQPCLCADCRALLNRYQPDFVTYLDLPSLIPYLNRHSLLTRQQDELLRNEHHTKQDRVLKLLEYIEGKGPEGYKKFVQALREERTHMGHKELYKCLTKTEPRKLL